MFGTERGDSLSRSAHDNACHIGRPLGWCSTFKIDAVGQARDQIAPFGIDSQVERLQKDGNRLRGGLHRPAILNDHRDDAFTAGNGGRQLKTGAGIA